ncbi:hypothetical protein GGR51DRAFT_107444 [Nemania sp. FL0031]|nr:hypothetical protein GGR51DRAFT_107444 [Nemania sp. FL0031]
MLCRCLIHSMIGVFLCWIASILRVVSRAARSTHPLRSTLSGPSQLTLINSGDLAILISAATFIKPSSSSLTSKAVESLLLPSSEGLLNPYL